VGSRFEEIEAEPPPSFECSASVEATYPRSPGHARPCERSIQFPPRRFRRRGLYRPRPTTP
jgi:hypothetical protein